MKTLTSFLCIAALFLSGCASSLMKPAEEQTLKPPPAETSRVIFLRPSNFGGAIQAPLFDVSDGKPVFLGVSSVGTKIVYDTTPGKHHFMVVSEAADFLNAELAAGMTYYAVVSPRMGLWKARFSLWPVKADRKAKYSLKDKEFPSWLEEGKLVTNTPKGERWARDNAEDIQVKYSTYKEIWVRKSDEAQEKRTLETRMA